LPFAKKSGDFYICLFDLTKLFFHKED